MAAAPGRIYLVGFMGSGKSTIGRALADELGWNFADLDADIERSAQTSIADIFDQQGEAAFRTLETTLLRERVRSHFSSDYANANDHRLSAEIRRVCEELAAGETDPTRQ